MHTIEIYFVGGTTSMLTGLPNKTVGAFVEWLDSKESLGSFKIDFEKHNKTTCLRKELILFANII